MGTPYRAVHFFLADGSQGQGRVEPVIGYNHGGAVGDTVQVAQHHAETMVKRHRDTEPVLFRELHGLTDKIAVVEDIEMSQCRSFGRTGRAAGELDVNGVIGLQQGGQLFQPAPFGSAGPLPGCR